MKLIAILALSSLFLLAPIALATVSTERREAHGHAEALKRLRALRTTSPATAKPGTLTRLEGVVVGAVGAPLRSSREGAQCVAYQVLRHPTIRPRHSDVACADFAIRTSEAFVVVRGAKPRLALGRLTRTTADEYLLEVGDSVVVAGMLTVQEASYRGARAFELSSEAPIYLTTPDMMVRSRTLFES